MQYSAMPFSAPLRVTFSGLYRPTVHLDHVSDGPPGRSVHYESDVAPIFLRYLYRPAAAVVRWLDDFVRPVQSGDVNPYLLYVFLAVVIAYPRRRGVNGGRCQPTSHTARDTRGGSSFLTLTAWP